MATQRTASNGQESQAPHIKGVGTGMRKWLTMAVLLVLALVAFYKRDPIGTGPAPGFSQSRSRRRGIR